MPELLVPACVWCFCLAPQQRLPLWRRPGLSGSCPLAHGQPPFASVDNPPPLLLHSLLLVLLRHTKTLLTACNLLCKPLPAHPCPHHLSHCLLPRTGTCLRRAPRLRSACGPRAAAACLPMSGALRSRQQLRCHRCAPLLR